MNPQLSSVQRRQKTLSKEVVLSGIGLHTGEHVTLSLCPAKEGAGIAFQRVDLPGQPVIPATVEYVCDTNRNTTIGIGEVKIYTIEHVLSALRAYEIDNAIVKLSSVEPPVGDGSALPFIKMIEEAGIVEQSHHTPIVRLNEPLYWSQGRTHIIALPSETYQISYTLQYPNCRYLDSQFFSASLDSKTYVQHIAPCRTFSKYEEITYLMDKGLIKGGSLSNAVIIKDDVVLSKGGLHFPNEMVRHKVLDLIGDLALVGIHFVAHIIAICSGHAANVAFAKKVYQHITKEKS